MFVDSKRQGTRVVGDISGMLGSSGASLWFNHCRVRKKELEHQKAEAKKGYEISFVLDIARRSPRYCFNRTAARFRETRALLNSGGGTRCAWHEGERQKQRRTTRGV